MAKMDRPRRLLMLTNSELGAANIFLAAIHELMQLDPQLEIHLVSFANIAKVYNNAVEYAAKAAPHARPPVFHQLEGSSLSQALVARNPRFWDVMANRLGGLNPFTISATARATSSVMMAWDSADFVAIYHQLETILKEVQPDFAVLDPCFAPGWTLCEREKLDYVLFQPNSVKELSVGSQPHGQALWKYPTLGTGFRFPVPWYQVPLNIYCGLAFFIALITDPRAAQVTKEVQEELGFKITTLKEGGVLQAPQVPVILGCRQELDFPMTVLPDFLRPCGPIVRPGPAIGETDPVLEKWLARGRTVYINMGTLRKYGEDEALEMAKALRMLLDKDKATSSNDPHLQILWKLKKEGEYSTKEGSKVYSILQHEVDEDRVRIADWLEAEPSAILESGHVICSVNHGGASSWYEALCAGVPQVILPVWSDTYEAPRRAELLGVGCWGNPTSAPKCVAAEVGPSLIDVVLGPNAAQMRARAKEVAAMCTSGGHGRTKAAKEILKFVAAKAS